MAGTDRGRSVLSEPAGRADELAAGERAAYAASRGRPAVVLVEGEPGIGKTAVIQAVAARAVAARFRVLRVPGAGRSDLLAAIDELRKSPPTTPICVVIDDAQRGDAAAATTLGRLLDGAARRPLLLLVAARVPSGPIARSLAELMAAGVPGVRLPLGPLPDEVLRTAFFAGSSTPPDCGGNPAWARAIAAGDARPGIPGPMLTRAAEDLLDALEPVEREVVEVLAHAESALLPAAVTAALDGRSAAGRTARALGPLIDDGGGGIRLVSTLLRTVVVAGTSDDAARGRHRALAAVTAGRVRLHHLVAAAPPGGDVELADKLESESDAALARGDYADAALCDVYAARASTGPAEYERRMLDAGTIIGLAEELALARSFGGDVANLPAGPTRDLLVAGLAYFAGDYAAAERALLALLERPDEASSLPVSGRRVAWLILSSARALTGEAPAALAAALEADRLGPTTDDRIAPLLDRVHGMQLATSQWANGRIADALTTLARLLGRASSAVEHTDALLLRGAINYYGGRRIEAREDLRRGVAAASPEHAVLRRRLSEQTMIDFHLGNWSAAQQHALSIIAAGRRERDPRGLSPASAALAMILTARGSHDLAAERLRSARADAGRPSLFVRLHLASAEAWIARERGDAEEVLRVTEGIASSVLRPWSERTGLFSWHALRVGALFDTGAVELAEEALVAFDRLIGQNPSAPLVFGHPEWLRGRIAVARGDLGAARLAFDSALRLSAGVPHAQALTARSAGSLAARQGRSGDAMALLGQARTMLLALGASSAAGRIDTGEHEPPTVAELSVREREVARFASRGWTNQRIADELVLSVKTVEFHVSRILKKLRVTSRRELFDLFEPRYDGDGAGTRPPATPPRGP